MLLREPRAQPVKNFEGDGKLFILGRDTCHVIFFGGHAETFTNFLRLFFLIREHGFFLRRQITLAKNVKRHLKSYDGVILISISLHIFIAFPLCLCLWLVFRRLKCDGGKIFTLE